MHGLRQPSAISTSRRPAPGLSSWPGNAPRAPSGRDCRTANGSSAPPKTSESRVHAHPANSLPRGKRVPVPEPGAPEWRELEEVTGRRWVAKLHIGRAPGRMLLPAQSDCPNAARARVPGCSAAAVISLASPSAAGRRPVLPEQALGEALSASPEHHQPRPQPGGSAHMNAHLPRGVHSERGAAQGHCLSMSPNSVRAANTTPAEDPGVVNPAPTTPLLLLRDDLWNLNTGVRMTSPARLVRLSIRSHRLRALDVRRFATDTIIVRYRCACHWLTKTLMSESRSGTPRTRQVLPPIHHFALALHYPSDVGSLYDRVDAPSLPDSIWLNCSKDFLYPNNKAGRCRTWSWAGTCHSAALRKAFCRGFEP